MESCGTLQTSSSPQYYTLKPTFETVPKLTKMGVS